jgi:hypothetical protein
VALPVAPDELEAAVRGARALGLGGMNVTVRLLVRDGDVHPPARSASGG